VIAVVCVVLPLRFPVRATNQWANKGNAYSNDTRYANAALQLSSLVDRLNPNQKTIKSIVHIQDLLNCMKHQTLVEQDIYRCNDTK
jgi:hypothetical protein